MRHNLFCVRGPTDRQAGSQAGTGAPASGLKFIFDFNEVHKQRTHSRIAHALSQNQCVRCKHARTRTDVLIKVMMNGDTYRRTVFSCVGYMGDYAPKQINRFMRHVICSDGITQSSSLSSVLYTNMYTHFVFRTRTHARIIVLSSHRVTGQIRQRRIDGSIWAIDRTNERTIYVHIYVNCSCLRIADIECVCVFDYCRVVSGCGKFYSVLIVSLCLSPLSLCLCLHVCVFNELRIRSQ